MDCFHFIAHYTSTLNPLFTPYQRFNLSHHFPLISVTLTDLQALYFFALELAASLFPNANVYLARQKTDEPSAPTYLAAVVESVWRDQDDASKGVKRKFVVGMQGGETMVLALEKLVERLEDVAKERFEKILEEEEMEEDEGEEEDSDGEEKGEPQVVVDLHEEEVTKNNPVEKPTQNSSTAAATVPTETPRQTSYEEEVAKNNPVEKATQKSSIAAVAVPADPPRQTRASAKATKAAANENASPAPVITTSKSKSIGAVPDSDSSSLSDVDNLIERLEAEADSTDALKGNWGRRENIVVEPKRAAVSKRQVNPKKPVELRKQVKPKEGETKVDGGTRAPVWRNVSRRGKEEGWRGS
jgi:outer membrane biosynthesis protein TonB